jgi:NADH/NAD ratio-sensing transcriptional regulator Rex
VSSRLYDPFYQTCTTNLTPIMFSIYSDMCIMGGCGKYGRCYQVSVLQNFFLSSLLMQLRKARLFVLGMFLIGLVLVT